MRWPWQRREDRTLTEDEQADYRAGLTLRRLEHYADKLETVAERAEKVLGQPGQDGGARRAD